MINQKELDALRNHLEKNAPQLESLVPEAFRKNYLRFVKIGIVYILGNEDRIRCTDESLLECMLKAAQIGLAVDGRMAHIIPYQVTVQGPDGKNLKISNAVLQVDYKGIVAVMKRSPKIKDVFARVVYKGDKFRQHYEGPVATLTHEPSDDPRRSTQPVIGVYSVIVFADGYWRHEYADHADIERIKARSASAKGPWSTDYAEMAKKTVIKRQSKLEMDIEEIDYLLEASAREDEMEANDTPTSIPTGAISYEKTPVASFTQRMAEMAEKVPLENPQTPPSPTLKKPSAFSQKVAEERQRQSPGPIEQSVKVVPKEDMTFINKAVAQGDIVTTPNKAPDSEPVQKPGEVPEWAVQILEDLSRCTKYGPTMSHGNMLMDRFEATETTDEDRINWFPTLFEEWSTKFRDMIVPIDRPTILKKLNAWQPKLGAIHGRIMQILKPALGQ